MQDIDITKEIAISSLWRAGLLSWKLWPQQAPIYRNIRSLPDSTQLAVVLCARQFGKSYLGTLLAVEDCLRNPGVSVLIVGPTIKQTTDIVNQSLKNLSIDAPKELIRRSKSESRWYIGQSELIIGGFDIQNASRQRGKTLYNIYIEEIMDSNPDQYHESIRSDLAPALTHSKSGKLIFLTTLPKIPDHPFLIETIPEAELKGSFTSYTIEDNAMLSLSQKQACIDRCGGVDSIEYQREYLNRMVRDQSLMVVPCYSEKDHVGKIAIPQKLFRHITIDWGGVKDFTACLLHTYDFLNNKHLILAEKVFDANTPTETIVNFLRGWISTSDDFPFAETIHCDAPGQILVDLINTHGLTVYPCPKEDWLSAVNQMSTVFTQPGRILIDPSCVFLRQSLRSGTFNRNRTDFERTKALGHCDALAALMYALRVQNKSSPYQAHQVPGGVITQSFKPLLETHRPVSFDIPRPKKFGVFSKQ